MDESRFEEIDAILNARSMAIVGASNNPGKFGGMLTASQLTMGFTGPLYLVNPKEQEIMGRKAYPDLASLPETPDLVYVGIPAHRSLDVLRTCAGMGVKAVVMVAAGFGEIGAEGKEREQEALRIAREGGFRIIGPNCFGIYNPRNHLTLLPGHDFSTLPGDVAFLSQSGGFAAQMGRLGKGLEIPFSAIVSYGNGIDLNEVELLQYLARDPQTRFIAAYLEGTRDGPALRSALQEASARKPVILWKVGRSSASRKAVMSHTGSMAGSAEIWDALLRQTGAISASGIEEICDVLLALRRLGERPGGRLLVAGGGGGLGTHGADLAGEHGLEVPPLAVETARRLGGILKAAGAVASNPLDIGTPLVPMPILEPTFMAAAENPTTDIFLFDLAVNFARNLVGEEGLVAFADLLGRVRETSGKPVAIALYSRSTDPDDLETEGLLRRIRNLLLEKGVAVFPSMRRAVRAIALVNQRPVRSRDGAQV